MELKNRLKAFARSSNTRLDVIQQDYLLSWILEALSESQLKNHLVFKGGTSLKKCYFGDYRFSEDLDFTAKHGAPKGAQLEKALRNVCLHTASLMNAIANIKLDFKRYQEKAPHPNYQEAFIIRAQYPWQNEPLTKIMIEVTFSEKILTPPVNKKILHPYGEAFRGNLEVYSLEEIVIEKLRALLENAKKIHEKGWARSRVRDYYDLHRITQSFSKELSWKSINIYLQEKCSHKSVSFINTDDFFEKSVLEDAEKNWEQWLGHLTPNPLAFSTAIFELKKHISKNLIQNLS
ncbi:MAG: nucleotidyl transferase AbiEii/AbiGii toxin family protein [Chlamydiales bacterium]|nr:nucleotidyl transferase AbiEii/AbiGii toxin family protein [Chlamydiales bacterium]